MGQSKLGMRSRKPLGVDDTDADPLETITGALAQATGPQIAADVTVVANAAPGTVLNSQLNGAAGLNGYPTGNSEWLHMSAIAAANGDAITIWAYNYAFGRWSELQIPVGNGTYAPATFTLTNLGDNEYFVIPIRGVDRVAITAAAGDNPSVKIAFNNF